MDSRIQLRELENTGEKISAVGLGTWQFGSKDWGWQRDLDRKEAEEIVNKALDLGANLFDTAEVYAGGRSEEILGEIISERRDEAFIATKVSPHHLLHGSVLKAADRSLSRLSIDTIDLYQVHRPNPIIPISSTMKAMEELVAEGKVRYIGVSNFNVSQVKSAEEALNSEEIVSNQVVYNLLQRDVEDELLPYCEREGKTLLAYSPLAQGALTDKYTSENRPSGVIRAANPLMSSTNLRRIQPLLNILGEIGHRRDMTRAQVALSWLVHNAVVVPIPGAKSVSQLEDNLASAQVKLTDEEMSRIEDALDELELSWFRSRLEIPLRLLAALVRS